MCREQEARQAKLACPTQMEFIESLLRKSMKNTIIWGHLGFAFCLCAVCLLVLSLGGCLSSPGETSREIHRKHMTVIKTNTLQIQDDADAILHLDQPSRLSEKLVR
jgi:hypothetical protein